MIWLTWVFGVLGLIVSSTGAILLYKGTPLDHIGISNGIHDHELEHEVLKKYEDFKKRARNTRRGIIFVGIGFVIQLISQLLNIPL